jgi:hypothetical protein
MGVLGSERQKLSALPRCYDTIRLIHNDRQTSCNDTNALHDEFGPAITISLSDRSLNRLPVAATRICGQLPN